MATARGGTSRPHTSNIVLARLADKVWCTKFQSSFLNIYFRLNGFQASLLPILLPPRAEEVFIQYRGMAQSLSDMSCSTNVIAGNQIAEIAQPQLFLCVNRSRLVPSPYLFVLQRR